jgi:lipopolysaccharide/colanic/teichoic acid biosynthesis glycosyltransferase
MGTVVQAWTGRRRFRLRQSAEPRYGSIGWRSIKRALDVLIAVVAIVVLAPVLVAVAIAVKLDSSGPLLFRQRRLGRDLRSFTMLKFRTMYPGVSNEPHRLYIEALARGDLSMGQAGLKKLVDDPRVTHVGRILRRLSLDELPQLFNVLVGTMSLIGPRPALEYELEHYRPEHFERFSVRPGLSGLWQVSGRNELGFNEMLELDVQYTRQYGPATDLRVFVLTPQAMVRGSA